MTEELRADLVIGLQEALRSVDELRSDIEEALTGAAGAFEEEFARITGSLPPVEIEADAEAVAPAIEEAVDAADSVVPIEGDGFDQLTLGIDEAIDAAEAVVPIEADTAAAEAAIEDLADTAASAGGAVGGLTEGLGSSGLSGVAGLAQGSVSGLGAAVGGMGGQGAAAVGVVTALAGTVGLFFNEAVDALGATQRFNSVLGDMAGRVENLRDIEGLNTNLGELALTLGSDDDKVRTVAARLFELARSSNIAEDDASRFTQQMIAMGARAVALNPELGDMGDVTDSLSSAFVRGGKFAAKYGLDLNQNLITDRAIEQTGKLESELTFVDKAMAGAALASEKYGNNLEGVIARGSENAITKQRRLKQTVVENFEALGAPLVAPIFEIMEDAVPVVEDVGRVVSALARGSLPVLIAALEVVTPILELVADVAEAIPAPVLAMGVAFFALSEPTGRAHGLLRTFSAEAATTPDKIGRVVVGLGLLKMGFDQAGDGGVQGALGIAQMAAGGAALGSVIPGVGTGLGALAGGAIGVGKALFGGGESADEFRERISKLSRELTGLSAQKAAVTFIKQVDDAFQLSTSGGEWKVTTNVANIRKELEQLARTDPGNAQNVLDGLARDDALGLTAQQLAKLRDGVNEGTEAYGKHADKARRAAEVNREVAAAADTSATAYDRAKAAADTYRQSLEQLDAGHTSAFEAETSVHQALATLTEAFTEAKGSIDVHTEAGVKNRDALVQAANEARNYSAAVLESGGTSEAARAPLANLATQITDMSTRFGSSPAEIAKLLNSLGLLQFASPEVQAAAAAMGIAVTTEIGGKSEEAAGRTAAAMANAKGAIDNAGLPQAAAGQARGAVDAFGQPIQGGLPGAVEGGVAASRAAFDRGALKEHAEGVGHAVGRAFGEGIEAGIYARQGDVAAAAAYIVNRAVAAARAAADARSPSRVFARLGEDMGAGVAVGMGDSTRDVVKAAEEIVRAAAHAARPPDGAMAGGWDEERLARALARAFPEQSGVTVVRVDTLEEAAQYVPVQARSTPEFLNGRR